MRYHYKGDDCMKQFLKKWLPVASVVALLLFAVAIYIYHQWPKNVFDELNWETKKIEFRLDSHLLDEEFGTEEAYDFGNLIGISLHNWDIGIFFWSKDELFIYVDEFEETEEGRNLRRTVSYTYNTSTRKLVGGQPIEYLIEHFLADYFAYCEENGIKTSFSVEDLGSFDMEVVDYMDRIYD